MVSQDIIVASLKALHPHSMHLLYDVLGNEVKMGPVKLPMSAKHAVWELKEKIPVCTSACVPRL